MKTRLWIAIHWIIILNFLLQIVYGAWQTFTLAPPGQAGVLFGAAKEVPFEMMVVRRLYAIETWIAVVGLSLYLALTEILPARLTPRGDA